MEQILTNHEDIFSEPHPGTQNFGLHHSQTFSQYAPLPHRQNGDIRPIEEFISSSLFSDAANPENFNQPVPNGPLAGQAAHLNAHQIHSGQSSYGFQDPTLSVSPYDIINPQNHKVDASKHRTVPATHRIPPRRGKSLMWALFGFILGIIFWHFVGFWNFVNGALLTEPQNSRLGKEIELEKKVERVSPSEQSSSLQNNISKTSASTSNHTSCTDLVMNREKSETRSQACEPGLSFIETETSGPRVARLDRTD